MEAVLGSRKLKPGITVGEPYQHDHPLHYSGVNQSYSVACLFVAASLLPAAMQLEACVKYGGLGSPAYSAANTFHRFHATFKSLCIWNTGCVFFTLALCARTAAWSPSSPPSDCAAPSSPPCSRCFKLGTHVAAGTPSACVCGSCTQVALLCVIHTCCSRRWCGTCSST